MATAGQADSAPSERETLPTGRTRVPSYRSAATCQTAHRAIDPCAKLIRPVAA